MPSSKIRNGVPAEIESVLPPELSSVSEKWLAEQWLLSSGVVPDSSADTLLMYAYAQKGVSDVNVEIDNKDEERKDVEVRYFVKLEPQSHLKWLAVKKAEAIKNPLAKKAALVALGKIGAPIAICETIKRYAQEYLPPGSKVEVNIVE